MCDLSLGFGQKMSYTGGKKEKGRRKEIGKQRNKDKKKSYGQIRLNCKAFAPQVAKTDWENRSRHMRRKRALSKQKVSVFNQALLATGAARRRLRQSQANSQETRKPKGAKPLTVLGLLRRPPLQTKSN